MSVSIYLSVSLLMCLSTAAARSLARSTRFTLSRFFLADKHSQMGVCLTSSSASSFVMRR